MTEGYERRMVAHLGCEKCNREVTVRMDQISCPNCGAALWEDEDCAEMLRGIALRISANIGFDPSVICRDLFAISDRLKILAAQGIETRSAETERLSPKGESPVAESDAPNPNPSQHQVSK